MKKKIQKPFDLEAWKNGAKIETRDGRSVRILCTDIKSGYSIVAAIMCKDGEEAVIEYGDGGHFCVGCEDDCDLVIVEEIEEPERWADNKKATGEGWFIDNNSNIQHDKLPLNSKCNHNVFATEKQAKSALAMARISQLMAHDARYGGVVTDEEWNSYGNDKFVLDRLEGEIGYSTAQTRHHFLAFHTKEQRNLFLAENERLVKDYLMID